MIIWSWILDVDPNENRFEILSDDWRFWVWRTVSMALVELLHVPHPLPWGCVGWAEGTLVGMQPLDHTMQRGKGLRTTVLDPI